MKLDKISQSWISLMSLESFDIVESYLKSLKIMWEMNEISRNDKNGNNH